MRSTARIAKLPAYRIVIVEGALRPDLSDLAGLHAAGAEILSLAEALQKPRVWLKQVWASSTLRPMPSSR